MPTVAPEAARMNSRREVARIERLLRSQHVAQETFREPRGFVSPPLNGTVARFYHRGEGAVNDDGGRGAVVPARPPARGVDVLPLGGAGILRRARVLRGARALVGCLLLLGFVGLLFQLWGLPGLPVRGHRVTPPSPA